jgi:hypothetical protein
LVGPNNVCTGNGVAWYADDPNESQRSVVIVISIMMVISIVMVASIPILRTEDRRKSDYKP